MAEATKRLCRVERNRMWTSWSATIPFLLAMASVIATLFWDVFSVWAMILLVLNLVTVGLLLTHFGSEKYAVLPFVYCQPSLPGEHFVVVRYKTYWGNSRGMNNYIWQQAEHVLPGIYRLQGPTFEANTIEMTRCPDLFHDNDEYDESEADNDA